MSNESKIKIQPRHCFPQLLHLQMAILQIVFVQSHLSLLLSLAFALALALALATHRCEQPSWGRPETRMPRSPLDATSSHAQSGNIPKKARWAKSSRRPQELSSLLHCTNFAAQKNANNTHVLSKPNHSSMRLDTDLKSHASLLMMCRGRLKTLLRAVSDTC